MRQVTATEKYHAVLEGKMAKREFVRQMRQAYPMYVSQYNGFDDTVQILKNRQMIFETVKPAFSEAKVYDDRPALTYSLDALDRGIRAELQIDGVDFKEAEKRAKDNLEKDANHYINLMSGESNKVDKHDKEKEVKRGAADKDTFNDMKKATLKEEVEESIFDTPRMGGFHNSKGVAGHVSNTHKQDKEYADSNRRANKKDDETEMSEDAKKNLLGKVVGALRTKYPEITAGIVKDFIKTHYQDLLDGADIEGEFEEYIYANYETASDFREGEEEEVELNTDADFEREQRYQLAQREAKGKDHDGDGDIDSDDYMAAKDKAIKKAMGKDEMKHPSHRSAKNQYAQRARTAKPSEEEKERRAKEHQAFLKRLADKDKEIAARKQAQLKEAIKSIIKKTLNEDVINEAATSRLSQKMEDFGGYSGAQSVINSLENIVTEVESFYGKIREKIQKVYDDMNNIENEEGLKIGPFIGPSIESAFMQDLRPVTKKGFTSGLELPKAKQIDPEMLAQARAAGEVDEAPEEPKSTVFSPNF